MLPSPEQESLERFNMLIAEIRVIRQLEKEAFDLWYDRPLNERYIKVGWFRKIEGVDKRDRYIKAYIDEHFESRMKEEYEVDYPK